MKRRCGCSRPSAQAVLLFATALSVFPATAQFDPAIFTRWGSVEVLKYTVIATYAGESMVTEGGDGLADVTDRYEIEFRWNQFNSELIGEPEVRNYPSVVKNVRGRSGCEAPELTGPYEEATVIKAEQGYTADLHLTLRTETAPANVPVLCSGKKHAIAGVATEEVVQLPVHGIAMWGLPAGSSDQMVVSGDTLTIKDGGWTFAYSLGKG